MKHYLAAAAAALLATSAHAADFSFTGSFVNDNDKAAFTFTVGAASQVVLRSWSYAGGVNAAGQTIARGGFDPILSLYDSSGQRIGQNDDDDTGNSIADAVTGSVFDVYLSNLLTPGDYTVYVTQYDNFAPENIPGAFPADGDPDFRNGFVDVNGDVRDGHWAFDILNVDVAAGPGSAVPEPASWAMMLVGFGLVGAAARRRTPARQTA
ncbi:DVUA0089 family protein [Sphingomonas quercus]|uniref:DVUA0089 family protein n=1 Tax=Sphingomonas quercus TaxID=2842451 RepID=A0ABS6BLR5_9SPHN|nr:DVUA0089 family protein [Sphingomonas quercus]MBU3079246.1 DVUA0089 family protein [Sphingomonas quercus]